MIWVDGTLHHTFFPDTTWDDIKGAEITYSGRQGDNPFTGSVRKKTNRWRGNPDRQKRNVVWVDLSRIQPIPYRSGHLKLANPEHKEVGSHPFDDESVMRFSNIMGRRYDSARMASNELDESKFIPVMGHRGRSFSGFHSGAGELTAAELIDTQIPPTSIVLIDEIESSLHPRAQRRVVRDLAQIARLRDAQIIFTTHSPYVLDELPPEGRLYVADEGIGKALIGGVSAYFAMTQMDDEDYPECDVYVEDTVAEDLLREIVVAHAPDILSRIRFVPYGPANVGAALGQMNEEGRFPNSVVVFLDGDQPPVRGCSVLPGGDAPERTIFESMDGHWERVAQRLDRSPSQLADACEKAMTRGDSHEWIDAAADAVFVKGSILWQAMCATWAKDILAASEGVNCVDAIRAKLN